MLQCGHIKKPPTVLWYVSLNFHMVFAIILPTLGHLEIQKWICPPWGIASDWYGISLLM